MLILKRSKNSVCGNIYGPRTCSDKASGCILWRVAGKWANVSIFKVESPGELHEILESLPLYPYMDVEVAALCRHPGSLEAAE
jgi:muconolactone delta-isomerase